jgi:hypothetical protein
MKYFLFIVCFFACKNKSGPELDQKEHSKTRKSISIPTIDSNEKNFQHLESDSTLNKAIERIHQLPVVIRLEKKISISTNGAHNASFISNIQFNGDSSYYHIQVGDNSQKDRYVVHYNFLVDKKSGSIKAYDSVRDSIISIDD